MTIALLAGCFFLTGGAALVYEIVWARQLALLFGSTAEATGLVLAVYMAGLGLGAPLFGRLADRSRAPLRLYALLEAGVGVLALGTTPLLALVRAAYPLLGGGASEPALAAVKALLSAAVLLPATLLMGGTLPVLSRALGRDAAHAPRTVAFLYALNIAGAVAGTLLAGFLLVERLGLARTMALAAAADLAVAAAVLAIARRAGPRADRAERRDEAPAARPPARRLAAARLGLFGSGATFMAYEVVFTRLFGIVFGVSSYAFALTLAVCLAGLGAGGLLAARLVARRPATLGAFAASQVAVALAAALAGLAVPLVPNAVALARQVPELGFAPTLAVKAALAAALLLPLSVVAGLGVPLLLAWISLDVGRLGARIGGASLANTAGTLVGSLLTGFVLVTAIGSQRSLLLAAAASLATGVAVVLLEGRRRGRLAAAAVAVAALIALSPPWPRWVFLRSDTAPHLPPVSTWREFEDRVTLAGRETLFFEEGRNATVAVVASSSTRTLLSNGHPEASDTGDMQTQWFVGALPLAIHPAPKDVLVVGLASGVTAGTAARVPDVRRVDVVELEPAMARAAACFRHVNDGVLANPKVTLIFDDARSFVRTTPRRWDAIVSEPSNLWRPGVASLFTADFYSDARKRLKPGGLFAQWVQTYGLGFGSVRRVFATFGRAFPEVQVWWVDGGNLVLIGSEAPAPLDRGRRDSLFGGLFAEETRRYAGAASPAELEARYLLGTRETAGVAADAPVHTDDRPVLEFEAVRGLFSAKGGNGLRLLQEKLGRRVGSPPGTGEAASDVETWRGLAGMYESIGETELARAAALRAADGGGGAGALFLAAQLAFEEGDVEEAERRLAEGRRLAPAGSAVPDAALLEARIALREGKPLAAVTALAGVRDVGLLRFEALAAAGRNGEALDEAERLLREARLGGEPGAGEVSEIWERVASLPSTPEERSRAARLVAALPPAAAGFPRPPREAALAALRPEVADSGP